MKTKILALLLIFSVIMSFSSCRDKNRGTTYEVTYVYGDGRENKTEKVNSLEYERPKDPTRIDHKFVGWCTDEELTNFYDFTRTLEKNITLYAKWEIDYIELNDTIATKILDSNVKIIASFVNRPNIFTPSNTYQSQGSGVVYDKRGNDYYVLTNYHVVNTGEDYTSSSFAVYDMNGNAYSAELINFNRSFDLAILKITVSSAEGVKLDPIDIEKRVPGPHETLVSVGSPDGRFNAVSYGALKAYRTVDLDEVDVSNSIAFEVLWHDCYSSGGSSGGALLDDDGDLIGLNYAVGSEDGVFKYAFAIPSAKIVEFLLAHDTGYREK